MFFLLVISQGIHAQAPVINPANITTTQSANPATTGDIITTTWDGSADGNAFTGSTVTFNGTDNYIQAFPSSQLAGAGTVTFKFSVKVNALPASDRHDLFSAYDGGGANRWSIGVQPDGKFLFYNAGGTLSSTTAALTVGTTHNVEVLADFTNGLINFKVDGVDDIVTGWTATGLDTAVSLHIGRFGASSSKYFNGQMWDLTISKDGATHARYPLSEAGGTTIFDVSGNGRHALLLGTLTNCWSNTQTDFLWNITNGSSNQVNRLRYSEEFGINPPWIRSSGTVLSNNADGVAESLRHTSDVEARVEQIINTFDNVANREFLFRLKVKAANAGDKIGLGIYKANTDHVSTTAVSGGTVWQTPTTNVNGVNYTIPDNTSYHDVWVRVKYGPTPSSVSLYFIVYINGFQTTINSGNIFVKEAQVFEWQGLDHPYVRTTTLPILLSQKTPGLENGTADANGNPLTVPSMVTNYSNVGGGNVVMKSEGAGVFSSNYTVQAGHPEGITTNISVSASNDNGTSTVVDDDDVVLADVTAPVITLTGSDVTQEVGGTYTDAGATASDNIDGDITANIVVGGDTVDPNTVGTYVITYDVDDAAGNSATQVTRTVKITIENTPASQEVFEDIAGNANSTPATAAQINSINGVSGAIDGVDYSTALANGTYADPSNPTPAEIQAVIDAHNATLSIGFNDFDGISMYSLESTLHIKGLKTLGNVLSIYNLTGQRLLTVKLTEENVAIPLRVSKGIYIASITNTNGVRYIKKVVVRD